MNSTLLGALLFEYYLSMTPFPVNYPTNCIITFRLLKTIQIICNAFLLHFMQTNEEPQNYNMKSDVYCGPRIYS